MAKEIGKPKTSLFENIRKTDENGNEYCMARQLSKVLDYTDFRNFTAVIEKAWDACKNSGNDPLEHIVEFNEVSAFVGVACWPGSSASPTTPGII